jgi:hypothetical protein
MVQEVERGDETPPPSAYEFSARVFLHPKNPYRRYGNLLENGNFFEGVDNWVGGYNDGGENGWTSTAVVWQGPPDRNCILTGAGAVANKRVTQDCTLRAGKLHRFDYTIVSVDLPPGGLNFNPSVSITAPDDTSLYSTGLNGITHGYSASVSVELTPTVSGTHTVTFTAPYSGSGGTQVMVFDDVYIVEKT